MHLGWFLNTLKITILKIQEIVILLVKKICILILIFISMLVFYCNKHTTLHYNTLTNVEQKYKTTMSDILQITTKINQLNLEICD
jgi:hypothetical protein